MTSAFLLVPVALAFEYQVRHAPNVDLGYHNPKTRPG